MVTLRTGWDIDGVGHTFSGGVYDHMVCEGLEHFWKSGDDLTPYWNWYKDWGWTDKQFVDFCHRAADHGCLFTGHVREGYVEAIEIAAQLGHQIVIATDRSFGSTPEVSERLTVDWLESIEVEYDELIFGPDKTRAKCDVFVDDKLENYDALIESGCRAFLLNRPWNAVEGGDARMRVDSTMEYATNIFDITMQGYADLSLV